MRIIAGEHRGRRLDAPPGQGTRPMLDRVREALFATLGGRVEGALVLDLFAGSGSLGLEALSRGAASVRAVERDAAALSALSANVQALGLGERVEILRADALSERAFDPPAGQHSPWADLLFCDPPYALLAAERGRVLSAFGHAVDAALVPSGIAVLHAPRHVLRGADLARLGAHLSASERSYGTTSLWYVERRAPGAQEGA